MDKLKFCSTCRRVNQENFHGYIAWVEEDCYECPICGNKMIDTSISVDEYYIIDRISGEVNFLEKMIKLQWMFDIICIDHCHAVPFNIVFFEQFDSMHHLLP